MKSLIITSYIEKQDKIILTDDFDLIICADAGYERAKELKLIPHFIIGDYDSAAFKPTSKDGNIIYLPCEKDMTDTDAAVNLAIEKGATDITIVGGLGGRFDHTMGNLGVLAKYTSNEHRVHIMDGQNHVSLLLPGSYTIKKCHYKYIGLISYSEVTKGITLEGFKYPLTNFDLRNDTSLGVSNEILRDEGLIEFTYGSLLVILSNDL